MIDEETERIVEEAKARAIFVLEANWQVVQETAQALLEHETLSGMALEAVLSPVEEIEFKGIPLPERKHAAEDAPATATCTAVPIPEPRFSCVTVSDLCQPDPFRIYGTSGQKCRT